MKTCCKCGIDKELSEFHKRKNSVKSRCIKCCKEDALLYRSKNKDIMTKKDKERYNKNRDKILNQKKQYRLDNIDKLKEKDKRYYHENKQSRLHKNKIYRLNNIDKITSYYRNRRKDPFYKLTIKIRTRLSKIVSSYSITKEYKSEEYLECSWHELIEWLQTTGQHWDSDFNIYDYDTNEYHIDHMKTFADVKKGIYTLEEVCHWSNLWILPASINLSKGGTSWDTCPLYI